MPGASLDAIPCKMTELNHTNTHLLKIRVDESSVFLSLSLCPPAKFISSLRSNARACTCRLGDILISLHRIENRPSVGGRKLTLTDQVSFVLVRPYYLTLLVPQNVLLPTLPLLFLSRTLR